MSEPDESKDRIAKELLAKGSLKQDVAAKGKERFAAFKKVLSEIEVQLQASVTGKDDRVEVDFRDRGHYHAEMVIGGDILIFHLHSNVFTFESHHPIWNTSYVRQDPNNAYCSVIHVYNFLADSFRLNRNEDLGYLIGRIFVNREGNFMAQGRGNLSARYHDLSEDGFSPDRMKELLCDLISYALEFDLYVPPINAVQEATVMQMHELNKNQSLRTGKRLGYQFSTGDDTPGD